MKLSKLMEQDAIKKIVFCSDEEIKTGYCGDLMSDVIANSGNECIWVTVQAHKNSIAVALIKDIKAIVFTNNVDISQELIDKAEEENISLFSSKQNSFQVSGLIYKLLEDDQH